ncbi:MAG TPA: T9SS type A sorting domain-containing protein, partial [Candidatus Eisenbacteria bacterium]|nr:T9SS type A sorting domain-containing protein [Candidatus Eisenbacteria bacterium]
MALLLTALLAPSLAHAAWQPGGNLIGNGDEFAAAESDGHIIVAWTKRLASDRYQVWAMAWTAEGDPVAGWPSAGLLVSELQIGYSYSPGIAEDGAGGAFVAWQSEESSVRHVLVQRITAAGAVAAGWAPEGLDLGPGRAATLLPDGEGGVLVGLMESIARFEVRVRILRIDASGAPHVSWPVGGYVIPSAWGPGLAVDGQGHVFVSAIDYELLSDPTRFDIQGIRVFRLDENASPDPAWPEHGTLVTDEENFVALSLFPDGSGGAYAAWLTAQVCPTGSNCGLIASRFATRIRSDGVQDAGSIPAEAVYSVASDGAGGLLVGLVTGGRPGVLRLDGSGEVMAGWKAEGNAAMTETVDPWQMEVAGDSEGGAFVAWIDTRTGEPRLYAARLDDQGRLATGWPGTGSFVGASRVMPQYIQLARVGAGSVIALWRESTSTGYSGYITALRPGVPGPIVPPRPPGPGFGVVELRSNPARGPLTAFVGLQDGPAQIHLIDVAGRVVESREFDFEHQPREAVTFNRASALRAGVYWIRVSQGDKQASRK